MNGKLLTFKKVGDAIYPDKQLVGVFFVSRYLYQQDVFEIMPFTPRFIVYALAKNIAIEIVWSLARILYEAGFVDPSPEYALNLRTDWRWAFWRVIPKRNWFIDLQKRMNGQR